MFFTDAEAAAERATRVAAEGKIETAHTADILDIIAIDSAQQTDIELLKQGKVHAAKARDRLERRMDQRRQRGH